MKDKIHAVHGAERQSLCGRQTDAILTPLRTDDPSKVTCQRCRDSRRWTFFFTAALNRKDTPA